MRNLLFLLISSVLIAAPSSFKVEGMFCGVGCVNTIKTQIGTLEGINSCDVSFEKSIMVIDYDDSKLNDEQIIKLLTDSTSYRVTLLKEESIETSPNCKKSCCSKKEKKSFFKRLFSWF